MSRPLPRDAGTTWDIFCTVIDNFGDIGVTWRLARQLHREHPFGVRLWVDDLRAFARLCPAVDSERQVQQIEGVEIHRWREPFALPDQPGAVVIEAFGCELPAAYRAALRDQRSLWLNLEYLSAESWVADCHGLPSLQPGGQQKHFFFPGFLPQTGGLLRERSLSVSRQDFVETPGAVEDFLTRLGVPTGERRRRFSLFCYETPALESWLGCLSAGAEPVQLLVPEGRITRQLACWLGLEALPAGTWAEQGALQVVSLPFVSQDDYDRLLWSCDFNIVRGEDSFIRAQWAERAFLWHIYPQEAETHLDKLQAFVDLYVQALPEPFARTLTDFWLAWNTGQSVAETWMAFAPRLAEWTQQAEVWSAGLQQEDDLAGKLVSFHGNWL